MFGFLRFVLLLIIALAILLYFKPDLPQQLGLDFGQKQVVDAPSTEAPAAWDDTAAAAEADRIIEEAINHNAPVVVEWEDSEVIEEQNELLLEQDSGLPDPDNLEWRPLEEDANSLETVPENLMDADAEFVFPPLDIEALPAADVMEENTMPDNPDLDALQDTLQIERAINQIPGD